MCAPIEITTSGGMDVRTYILFEVAPRTDDEFSVAIKTRALVMHCLTM